jgi:hypothetical protein
MQNMNIGLGNLTELKGQLLAASLRATRIMTRSSPASGWAWRICSINFATGLFAGRSGKVDVFSADRRHWYLNCFPVETIAALAKKDDERTAAVSAAARPGSLIQAMQMDQGYIMFIALQGYYWSRLQVTYTGGYWFDTTEDGSGVMPATATPLPAAVKSAWYCSASTCGSAGTSWGRRSRKTRRGNRR